MVRFGTTALIVALLAAFLYEARETVANWYFYRSETSRELHVEKRTFAERARLLEVALRLSPTWRMHRSRGRLYLDEAIRQHEAGDVAEREQSLVVAIDELHAAIDMEPRESDNYLDLARSYLLTGFPALPYRDEAVESFRKSLERDPHDCSKLTNVARFLIDQYLTLDPPDRQYAREIAGRAISAEPQSAQEVIAAWRGTGEDISSLLPYVTDPGAITAVRREMAQSKNLRNPGPH